MRTVLLTVAVLCAVGCDSPGLTTEQACADFVDAGHCGPVDLSQTYNCNSFSSTSCDLAPYFECLAPHFKCVDGQFDSTAMMGASMCNDLAECR